MLLRISDKANKERNTIGNKAKFLSIMRNNKFNVPDGFILDSDSYDQFIEYNKLGDKLNSLLKKINKDNLKDISKKINELFINTKLSNELKEELRLSLKNDTFYAIRSSGLKEDLDNFSFAGQYDTFLNVKGLEEIEEKIIACYKSMFSEIILSYLLDREIVVDDLKMAVVIEKMVASEYSGICFTIDPVTGNDKEMLIEVAKGLGENIVSGKVKPEQYHYDWYNDLYKKNPQNKILTKKQVIEMGKIFSDIMELFGYPCDIEFALCNDKLFILQARRITAIKYLGIKDIWSTADFKDGGVSATVCTPYMWSLYEYIWEYTLRKFILDSKILKKADVNKKLGEMFYGRCYWNLSLVKQAMSQVIGYKEREFDSEYGIFINYEGDGDVTKVSIKSLINILRMFFASKKILNERNKKANYLKDDLLNKYDEYKMMYDAADINDIEEVFKKLIKDDYLYSESSYFWQIFINTIHQSIYKDSLLKYVSESEYLTLLGSIDNISHLLPFYDMWDLSRIIRNDEEASEFWNNQEVKVISKKINCKKYYMSDVREIIDKYGYHSDKELDVTYPCYYEDVMPIIQSIKDMVLLGDEFSPLEDKKNGTEKYNEILERIKSNVSPKKFKKINNLVKNMRKMLWWREEFRDISTRFYYIIRIYTCLLGEHFYKKKIISTVDDIWYLKIDDIFAFLDKKINKKELNNIIERNKKYYNSYRNYMSENEIGSIFEGNNSLKDNDSSIQGLGANNGIKTGVARVIEDFDDIDRLQENDILVTKFTDTGWTSKFAILSGIVTEYGGILCHAAIVSREYGIPAIVCCHGAMSKIKDGDIITIDGTTGKVKIEERKI